MLFSFRNRRLLIQATIPLARKLANVLNMVKKTKSFEDGKNDLLEEVLHEIEVQTSLNGNTSLALMSNKLLNNIKFENKIDLVQIEKLLDEMDLQHYHAYLDYEKYEDKKEWLTWYKLTPNMRVQDDFKDFIKELRKNLGANNVKLNEDNTIIKCLNIYFTQLKKVNTLYEKLYLSVVIDRLLLIKQLKETVNDNDLYEVYHLEAIEDALNYLLLQQEYFGIDSRSWSSLLWHANKIPTKLSESLLLNEEEDSLIIFSKVKIEDEISPELLSFWGKAKWPSWKALEGDFISLSELLESENISWSRVKDHLNHIVSQSVHDDKNWNPGIFFLKMMDHLESSPEEYFFFKEEIISRLSLWKDALLKRDPLLILNWVNLALTAKEDWKIWFTTDFISDSKVEQDVIYEIAKDLNKNPELAAKSLLAMGFDWIVESLENYSQTKDGSQVLKLGLLEESLFWAKDNPSASNFFAEIVKNFDESDKIEALNKYAQEIKSQINVLEVVENSEEEEFNEDLFKAIMIDADDMFALLQSAMNDMYTQKVCNYLFIRAVHSLKTLSLNLDHEYAANFFAKLEVWSIRMVEFAKKLSTRDIQMLFSVYSMTMIIISNWKEKNHLTNLPIDEIVDYLNNNLDIADNVKSNLNYHELFEEEDSIDREVDNIDLNIFDNFKEEALEIFDKLDSLLKENVKKNLETINGLLHTLKGGSRISGLMKLGMWVHQIEDLTTKKAASISEKDLTSGLQYGFDKARNIYSSSIFEYQKENQKSKEITLKIPLSEMEEISESLLISEASQKKTEVSFNNLKALMYNAKDPLKKLSFLVGEIYVEAESLLNSGSNRKKNNKLFDELELDKFTYFHELTRKLEEAVSDNALYNNLIEKHISDINEFATYSKTWLNIAQKDLVKNLYSEAQSYETRLSATNRSACNELKKEAQISFEGSSVWVDKKVLDEIIPALEHLVRNSVAHSIETPEERESNHKSRIGSVTVKTELGVDKFIFTIKDDGAGFNFDKIKEQALIKELLETDNPTKEDLCKVIFNPGFSTATTVTTIAGRGVGLDAVENIVQKLGGTIEIQLYDDNKGMFVIHIPMQSWLLSGVKAVSNEKIYIINNSQIKEVLILPSEEIEEGLREKSIIVNNVKTPCIYMDYIAGSHELKRVNRFHPVLLLNNGKAMIVDSVEFVEKQPVKGLPFNLYKDKGISGTTILSDSNVGIVIDALSNNWNTLYEEDAIINTSTHIKNNNLVLVVDDSLTIRKISEKFLTRNGYDYASVENGLEAVKYIEKDTLPAMILMDIEMPVMDGFEAIQKIKQIEYAKNIPIVIISSRAVEKHINYAKSIGALDFLGKPFNEEKLLNLLAQHVKKGTI